MGGPGRRIDARAMAHKVAATPAKWRSRSMTSALRFLAAGVVVALFGGVLLVGALLWPGDEHAPGVGATRSRPETPAATGQPTSRGNAGPTVALRAVVVAVRTIAQGTAIKPRMVTVRQVPLDATNEMALGDLEQAVGEVSAIDIVADQAITPNMFLGWTASAAEPHPIPTERTQSSVSDKPDGLHVPTRDVVVAAQLIEQGAVLEAGMLTTRAVALDASNEMAVRDMASVLGKEAAIGIIEDQAITPNLLVQE
jgi:flagella basal body P-ring formation protein FlgA